MAELTCGWCGGELTSAYWGSLRCGNDGCPVGMCWMSIEVWEHLTRVIALGREMSAALDRGRKLHPWVDEQTMHDALCDEIAELREELERDNVDNERVDAEAVDVWVTARRLKDRA